MFIFFPYVIVLAISFLLTFGVSVYAFRYKDNLGVKEFIFAMSAGSLWILCQCLELMATDLNVKYIFSSILYVGSGLAVFSYFLLALCFTGKRGWLPKKHKIIILSIYAFFFICIFTDIKFGLMRDNFGMDTSAIPYVITKDYSTLYPIYMLYVHSMTLTSFILLFNVMIKGDHLHKKQARILFFGLFIIVTSSIIYTYDILGEARFDSTPTVFGIAVTIYFLGIYRHKLLSIIPVSRNILVDIMDSGLLVLDNNKNVIDVNHAFCKIFCLTQNEIIGKYIKDVTILRGIFDGTLNGKSEIDFTSNKVYHLKIKSNQLITHGHNNGTMYIVDDITEQYINNKRLLKQQAILSIMNEREKLGKDLHDSFGQIFGYMSIQSQTVKEYLSQNNIDKAEEKLDSLITIAQHSHEDIRAFILQIQGSNQKNRNFRIALNQYIDDFRAKFNREVHATFSDDLPKGFPDDEKAIQIIQIIKEAFNNIIYHAGKCEIYLKFEYIIDDTIVTIEDNGKGFNICEIDSSKGYGLSIMEERAKQAGGSLSIDSIIGEGTKVKIRFEKAA